jgi:hypothetical protein
VGTATAPGQTFEHAQLSSGLRRISRKPGAKHRRSCAAETTTTRQHVHASRRRASRPAPTRTSFQPSYTDGLLASAARTPGLCGNCTRRVDRPERHLGLRRRCITLSACAVTSHGPLPGTSTQGRRAQVEQAMWGRPHLRSSSAKPPGVAEHVTMDAGQGRHELPARCHRQSDECAGRHLSHRPREQLQAPPGSRPEDPLSGADECPWLTLDQGGCDHLASCLRRPPEAIPGACLESVHGGR